MDAGITLWNCFHQWHIPATLVFIQSWLPPSATAITTKMLNTTHTISNISVWTIWTAMKLLISSIFSQNLQKALSGMIYEVKMQMIFSSVILEQKDHCCTSLDDVGEGGPPPNKAKERALIMDPLVVKNIWIGEYSEGNGWHKRKNLQEMGDDIYQGNIKTHTCFSKYLSFG